MISDSERLMNIYKLKIKEVWHKCHKNWKEVYELDKQEIYEFIWSLKMIKGNGLIGLSKKTIFNLIDKIKSGFYPIDMNAYLVGINKKEIEKMEREQNYFEYRMANIDKFKNRKDNYFYEWVEMNHKKHPEYYEN